MNDIPSPLSPAAARRQRFMAAVAPELAQREDELPADLARMNASARVKLRRVYAVMDELSAAREGLVACGKGCAHCCRINVQITKLEAEQLGRAIGRPPKTIARSVGHEVSKFVGRACPFLVDEACSVYEHRPLACRKHASYELTGDACRPENWKEGSFPLVSFSGLDSALLRVSQERGSVILADIRDFFPAAA